jgi:hypothetical protein
MMREKITQTGFFDKRVKSAAVHKGGHKLDTIKNIPETTERHCRAIITTSYYAMDVFWSGRQDSNLRPPAPKAGALTRLRYAPIPEKKTRLENRALPILAPRGGVT